MTLEECRRETTVLKLKVVEEVRLNAGCYKQPFRYRMMCKAKKFFGKLLK